MALSADAVSEIAAREPLSHAFYARPVLTVARDVIGKLLVRVTPAGVMAGRVVEAEAYRGPEDRAAHTWGGRRTARTEAMYGPPGIAYVFFVYGKHWHFNLVTTREAVALFRGWQPLGLEGAHCADLIREPLPLFQRAEARRIRAKEVYP